MNSMRLVPESLNAVSQTTAIECKFDQIRDCENFGSGFDSVTDRNADVLENVLHVVVVAHGWGTNTRVGCC